MMEFSLFDVIDPRGRTDRTGLIKLALLCFALEALLSAAVFAAGSGPGAIPETVIHSLAAWIGIAGTSKRLHDAGRSMWWCVGFLALWFGWTSVVCVAAVVLFGPDAVATRADIVVMVTAVSFVPALAAALWLQLARGEPTTNRYGVVPGRTGFSARVALTSA